MAAKKSPASKSSVFTAEERAAMRDLARERKAGATRAEGLEAVRKAMAAMPPADRVLAQRVHDLVLAAAPDLAPKTWYGFPAYAKDGEVVCFFQPASKFKARYATLGFSDQAALDEGAMWPVAFAVKDLTKADEQRISALVKRAAG